MNEQLTIGTPENVSFGYPIAGIGSRFVAALVDSGLILFLQLLVYATIFLALIIIGGAGASNQLQAMEEIASWLAAGLTLLGFVFLWGYYIFFEILWNGQSPGKRLMKLRVVRVDGGAVSLTESIIRNLVRLIDFLPISYGLGVTLMFINAQSRRLGDLAAGTLVVHDRLLVTLDSLGQRPSFQRNQYWQNLPALNLPLNRLAAGDLHLAQEFVLREQELVPNDKLAKQIVQYLYDKMELPQPNLTHDGFPHHLAAIVKQASETPE